MSDLYVYNKSKAAVLGMSIVLHNQNLQFRDCPSLHGKFLILFTLHFNLAGVNEAGLRMTDQW